MLEQNISIHNTSGVNLTWQYPVARALPLSDVHADQEPDSCRWNVAVAAKRLLEARRLA